MNKRRWIWSAIGVLAALMVFWITATLFLSPAYADALPFSMKVRSSLLADYNPDDGKSLFTALRISILGDTLRDQGLSPEEAEQQRLALEGSLDDPVPTATALDFEGNAPPTATPTNTATPTDTPTPTTTPTSTPRPTRTPTTTNTPKPTKTPKLATVTGPVDNQKPSICCLKLSPPAGTPSPGNTITSCRIIVTDLHVFDPAFSSGVNDSDVQLKYLSPTDGWKVNSLTRFSGDFVSGIGSDWDAHYSGTIDLDDVYDGDIIEVQARVDDISGSTSWVYTSSSYYTLMGRDCP